jgi:hypothetical protein
VRRISWISRWPAEPGGFARIIPGLAEFGDGFALAVEDKGAIEAPRLMGPFD